MALGPIEPDARTDRSVLGSMNDAKMDFENALLSRLANFLSIDPWEAAQWLNQRPDTGCSKWSRPEEVMQELLMSEAAILQT